jgi:putative spermidine/putrescine transport system ATP-binding protein
MLKVPHRMTDLELINLSKAFGSSLAVDEANFSLGNGEMLAVLGPSGCGKTTTLRMVAGFIAPTAGTIRLKGQDITALPPNHRNMGMVFQSYALFPHMTVFDNVAFGLRAHHLPKDQIGPRVEEYLALVGLAKLDQRYPKELSGGQQQRVALARVLAIQPQLLLFDEPLSNLDAKLRVQMRSEIRRLQRESGISAMFVTHDQEEAMVIADRIVVMNQGKVEQIGTPSEIYDDPKSRFVADFIGTTNLLPGRLSSGVFRTQRGLTLACEGQSGFSDTDDVVLLIRPEKISVAKSDGQTSLIAKVTKTTNLGSIYEMDVELPSGDALIIRLQCGGGFRQYVVGEELSISWRPQDGKILAA